MKKVEWWLFFVFLQTPTIVVMVTCLQPGTICDAATSLLAKFDDKITKQKSYQLYLKIEVGIGYMQVRNYQ